MSLRPAQPTRASFKTGSEVTKKPCVGKKKRWYNITIGNTIITQNKGIFKYKDEKKYQWGSNMIILRKSFDGT